MRLLRLAALLLLLVALAAPAVLAAPPAAAPQAAPTEQKFFFRVLDSRDHPLPSATLTLEPLAGHPVTPSPYKADEDGVIHISWAPSAKSEKTPGGDETTRFQSALRYRVSAPGHLSGEGAVSVEDKSRTMADERLAKLNRMAQFAPHGETVVLPKASELFAFKVPEPPEKDPLARACLDFRAKYAVVAQRLGASFAWPAFGKQGSRLEINFDWTGAPWGNQAPAPLAAKVAMFSGLPLMIAAGRDLGELPGIESLSLVFHSKIAPAGDEHAMPQEARIILSAPLSEVRRLARGEIKAGAFLGGHPPRLERAR
ncbi:MAG: hypothetical protein KQH53_10015 [Desulfarculaceae bacterium]|nr:hypothetical protein [Desulfarculaceae bacterium]